MGEAHLADRGVRSGVGSRSEDCTTSELVAGAAAGEAASWETLVSRHGRVVWAVARSFGLDARDAADVSQTTWLRLVENIGKVREPDRVGAWLVTTARRESLRVLRISGRSFPTDDDDLLEAGGGQASPIDDAPFMTKDRDLVVSALVGHLTPRQQMVLRLLSGADEISYRELSELLAMPVGSIGPTRARALGRLRRLCEQAGITGY